MTNTAATSKALGLRRSAARKARVALATALVAAGLVAPALVAGLVAPPAHAVTNTFTVTRIDDRPDAKVGDGICSISTSGTFCTLRAAIQEANATVDKDAINFGINTGGGVAPIAPNSALPTITEPVIIDGYTQQGAQKNTKTVGNDASLKIELDGTNAPEAVGLEIQNSSNSVIRGLVINRFDEGIALIGTSVGNRIEGNFIGTDPTGTVDDGAQTLGVLISSASKSVIGGSTPDKRNVISGNGDAGILIGFDSPANVIKGNYVGTDKSGTKDFGTQFDGIRILGRESGTTVGGTTAASRNVISGNNNFGLTIFEADGTKVLGNRIGTTANGTGDLGNDFGVGIDSSSDLLIGNGTLAGSNTVAFNGGPAGIVFASDGVGNEVSGNSIFANAGLGIDLDGGVEDALGNTANDPLDVDSGPNDLQNKPSVSSAKTLSGKTTIKGTLSSEVGKSYKIEFYSNPSGNEGKKFIGTKSVTTGSDGKAAFTFTPAAAVSVGQTITATATNATSGSPHDTSEFSAPRTVAAS
jgi:CSLREA domain-containing protein